MAKTEIKETPPVGLVPVRLTLYLNPADNALWVDKGPLLGWNRLASVPDVTKLISAIPVTVPVDTAPVVDTNLLPLFGKNLAVLGDSMSNPVRGASDPTADNIYWGLLKSWYGLNVDADGISGTAIAPSTYTGFTTNHFSADARIQGFKNRSFTPDIILIFGGTNDFGRQASTLNVQLGTYADPESNVAGSSSFYAALKYLYHNLSLTYPNAKIFHMEPLQRADMGFPATLEGKVLKDFINAIDIVAKDYGVTVIPTFSNSGFTYWNMTAGGVYSADGLHPNPAGHYKLAEYVGSVLRNHFKPRGAVQAAEVSALIAPVQTSLTLKKDKDKFIYAFQSLNFPSIPAQSSSMLTVACPGAELGDRVSHGYSVTTGSTTPIDPDGIILRVSAGTNILYVRCINYTAAAIDPPTATYKFVVVKPDSYVPA